MIIYGKRETTLTWWRTFTLDEQKLLVEKYFGDFNFMLMGCIKIEEIYDKEKENNT